MVTNLWKRETAARARGRLVHRRTPQDRALFVTTQTQQPLTTTWTHDTGARAHRRGYLDALCWLTLGATANDYLGAPLTHFAEPITPVSFCGAALRGRWSHAAKPFGTSTSK